MDGMRRMPPNRSFEMKKVVVFTGAGVSADSGLSTFRDADGLWADYRIEDVCTPAALALWHEFGGHIGRLVMMILYAYDPEAIVFGGSIAHAYGFFREAMYEQLKQFPYAKTVERLHICCSSVEHVGLLGASACE